ncbi:YqaE/Pmp3 family membrane protein [Halomonas koreensis]|uniref:YqaE/Pmp3 family membrane protein n=1 Tax=Halomonas koreensis TaxID=245385 RepID=A0ABU1G488_9GAMM|nr:YqaE/Pmp3 family membrane protein [Halomonas koreensis]MDR5867720.1 YqaE/Pmp3 family membrane protein [Halomonas koreensis]
MDAREYLARKGLDGERDRERPNTLEEKAWSRAREAGEHRPRAGTPHDWEDWERYHDELAEGAESLEQKVDHQAHRQALGEARDAVQQFTPRAGEAATLAGAGERDASPASAGRDPAPHGAPGHAGPVRPEPFVALVALGVLLPPLAMGLAGGGGRRVLVALGLTLLGWLPGAIYAVHWLRRR